MILRGLASIEEGQDQAEKGQIEAASMSEKEGGVGGGGIKTPPPPPPQQVEDEADGVKTPPLPPMSHAGASVGCKSTGAAASGTSARTSTGAHMAKQVTFQPHETPLMFSRASSFESLNSFDQHSIRLVEDHNLS